MAYGIPVRFKRAAPATSESSGSEHSSEGSMNLSGMVNSFMERGESPELEKNDDVEFSESETAEYSSFSTMEVELRSLLENSVEGDDRFKEEIRSEIEQAVYGDLLDSSERKRNLMNTLRNRGFDAGLCKSKWERTGKHPSGSYEYIDVKVSNIRYIVEIEISNEFAIARQSKPYSSLLDLFPSVFIGKAEDFQKILKLMCKAMKVSLLSVNMPMPPWRTDGYMKSKWFSAFKRTTNEYPQQKGSFFAAKRRSDGFEPAPPIQFNVCNCRKNLGGTGSKVGQLALAFNSPAIHL